MRVVVDRDICIVSGMCTSIAPEVFNIDDEGKMVIIMEFPPDDLIERVESAVLCCPVGALSLLPQG